MRSLQVDADGSVLELEGEPIIKVLPASEEKVDKRKLKAAILPRRDHSRRLNRDWQAVDRD